MSTDTPDQLAGALSRVISGLTQHVDQLDGHKTDVANTPAGLAADEMVRRVAASIEEAMEGFLDHLSNPLDHRHEGVQRQPDGPTDGEFSFDIGSLTGRIDEMRTQALCMLRSEHSQERERGRDELNVAVQLLNLLIFMLEQQMQVRVHRARIGR
jgi:hypothetical protein